MSHSPIVSSLLIGLLGALASLSGSGASTPGHGYLLVANKGDSSVSIIDPIAGQQLGTVAEGGVTGHELIASPDGRIVYVPIYGNSGVGMPGTDGTNMVAIDIAVRKVIGKVDFGHGVRPHCPMFGPKDGLLYVTTELDQTISVIDPHSLKIVGSIPTGQNESHMLIISHDGKRGYTANVGPGTVSVLDMATRKNIAVIPISKQTQRISISMNDRWVFTSDQTKPQLAVIDTATNLIKQWIPLPGTGFGSSVTPGGRWLVIAIPKENKVAAIDLNTMKVEHVIDVPAAPQETLIRPDGQMAYASCDSSHKVAAIRISDWTIDKLIDAGKGADGLAWANPR